MVPNGCHKPKQYPSVDKVIVMPFYEKTMPRDQYNQISLLLHFVNNMGDYNKEDRLWKLHPVIKRLQEKFATAFTTPQKITVNESLWKFRYPAYFTYCDLSLDLCYIVMTSF